MPRRPRNPALTVRDLPGTGRPAPPVDGLPAALRGQAPETPAHPLVGAVPAGRPARDTSTSGQPRLQAAKSAALEPLCFSFPRNGAQAVKVTWAATYSAAAEEYVIGGGGTVAYSVNGATATLPFSVSDGDLLVATLAGATGETGILLALTLRRAA